MDPRVRDLHCIMPIANLRSVMEKGILSYEQAARTLHESVAMQPVQERRDVKRVPGGLRLHQYANLYFHARNSMLYKRLGEAAGLCILSISLDVLAIPGVVITDCNAASNFPRFLDPQGWRAIVFDDVLARKWTHPDHPARQHQHKSRKCAEVLVPGRVPPEHIRGAYVRDTAARDRVNEQTPALRTKTVPEMFFS